MLTTSLNKISTHKLRQLTVEFADGVKEELNVWCRTKGKAVGANEIKVGELKLVNSNEEFRNAKNYNFIAGRETIAYIKGTH